MKKFKRVIGICLVLLSLAALCGCGKPGPEWTVSSHKTYYNGKMIKVAAQKENLIAIYEATETQKILRLGWRLGENKSYTSLSVYIDDVLKTEIHLLEEVMDGENNLYHAAAVQNTFSGIVKCEVLYKNEEQKSFEYDIEEILRVITAYAQKHTLNLL